MSRCTLYFVNTDLTNVVAAFALIVVSYAAGGWHVVSWCVQLFTCELVTDTFPVGRIPKRTNEQLYPNSLDSVG